MLVTIEQAEVISRAQASLRESVEDGATERQRLHLGYQGGGRMVEVFYIEPLDFWVGLADSRNRYWNALGLGNPVRDGRSIIAEINTPKDGINRRISGAYLRDGNGRIHLAHRGRIGGGRKGIGKKAFMAWYQGAVESVRDGDMDSEMILIGALDEPNLLERLSAFTRIVSIFKEAAAR